MTAVRLAVVLMAVMGSAPLAAHHSVLGFDNERSVTLHGRVAETVWSFPHVYIALDADGGPGAGARWLIESEAPAVLERLGWHSRAVRRGERVTVSGAPSRDGTRRMRCDSVATRHARLPCYPPGRTVHLKP